jgi:hypothetical protein
MPNFWEFAYSIESVQHFGQELFSKPGHLVVTSIAGIFSL